MLTSKYPAMHSFNRLIIKMFLFFSGLALLLHLYDIFLATQAVCCQKIKAYLVPQHSVKVDIEPSHVQIV